MTDDPNTTHILNDLFQTLRDYSQTSKITHEDILRQRARQYAEVPPEQARTTGEALTLITFLLESEQYGLDVRYARGVRPLGSVTRVPNAPSHYIGVTNVRGAVVTLLDLGVFFGLERSSSTRELIVVETGTMTLGLPVRRVTDVITVPKAQITGLEDTRYALGAYKRLVVLDAEEIFRDERLNSEAQDES